MKNNTAPPHDHSEMNHQSIDEAPHDHSEMNHQSSAETHQGHIMSHSLGVNDYLGLSLVLVFFVLAGLFVRKRASAKSSKRYDLFNIIGVERAIKSRYFSFAIRVIPALLFILVIATGLFGRTRANFAAPFTWLFWWTLLVFFVAFGGKFFCAACPWDFFANLFQFGWVHRIQGKVQSLNIKWPRALSNIYPAIVLFIVLTWLELGAEVAYNSYLTALLGLFVVGSTIVFALVFKKRAFCRYVCPVGSISGVYAQFSPLELRTKSDDVCNSCTTKECVTGGPYSTPCPTSLVPFKLKEDTYCTLCTECVRSCNSNNLTLKLRPPATGLAQVNRFRKDETLMAFVIVVLTYFHGITMIPLWFKWTGFLEGYMGLNYFSAFTLLMILILTLAFALYKGFCAFVDGRLKSPNISAKLIYAFIPLILGYHVGHNTMHFLGEGSNLVPLINDPFGYGWDLFGLKGFEPAPLLAHSAVRWIQLFMISLGFYYSVKVLKERTGAVIQNINGTLGQTRILFTTHYVLLFLIGMLSLWFVIQPMVMRSSY